MIERRSSLNSKASFHVKPEKAKQLIRQGWVTWAIPEKIIRKTSIYGSHQAEKLIGKFTLTATGNTLKNLQKFETIRETGQGPDYLAGQFKIVMPDGSWYTERLETVDGMIARLERKGELVAAA